MKIVIRTREIVDVSVDEAVETVRRADYVRWYDTLPVGDPDRISVLELAYPAFLDAVPNFKALLSGCGSSALQAKLDYASEVLAKVPSDVELVDWEDNSQNVAALKWLFQASTGSKNPGFPEFGPARATKMLHRKRPLLIPILDSWQLEAWRKRPDPWSTDDMVDVVFMIRGQLLRAQEEMAEVRRRLASAEPTLPYLSDVRLYDILFWEGSRSS